MANLYLVATPIGNLEDITLRALRVLQEVDLIAAEDTRRTRELLAHYDLHTPLTSYHRHNQASKTPYLLKLLQEGRDIALVSDAGLPGISDPGEELVRRAIAAGIIVVPIPGANAALAALVASGLPAGRFVFEGFLPRAGKERRERLAALAAEERTLIFYEAPHRLVATLSDLLATLGERRVAVGRELTKKFETIWRGLLSEAVAHFHANPPRGEITLVVAGAGPALLPAYDPARAAAEVAELEAAGLDRKEAMARVARRYGQPRREIYRACLQALKKGGEAFLSK
ncbi:16S rRNA (cytidine(1402)-2'-O)-methyltransferase [Neomoorella mulderi]|uniref:Ribosomal RNA small subunit methyltransferase I n=1 Tax=Moorella mulderi DSM 14980 TaxID=1122241 RepID=A0A151B1M3_9FIRM|nr:16S rRNA (cytidine(1402)-2'-O)-methyltransferase [Moorella mulderi]KYH33815.1 ribosomal RNA small subunit methyltransferase I [Moorella mulderi DSM 14980]